MTLAPLAACSPAEHPGGDGDGDGDGDAVDGSVTSPADAHPQTGSPDAHPVEPGGAAPGSACSCDDDCAADGTHPGVCVYGICMTQASGACSAGGSTAECGAGSRCWGLEGADGYICWPDCASHDCSGTCDG
ncbi:MAG TPA: hypothetical protein VL172_07255, partial [Kofleriaceae bacterium]|nr:hypothetical protein [Kofleriaceae bacterium]